MARFSAITIDVDSLWAYHQIHGLGRPDEDRDPIYELALPRFWELLSTLSLRATLFLIGADAPRWASAFAPVSASASEVASHSLAHDYRLTTLDPERIRKDLREANDALLPLNGGRPLRGFRAPGYNVSAPLLRALVDLGYHYDSSLLPSPFYFLGRTAAIHGYRLFGRRSVSLSGEPRQFMGPLDPYRTQPEAPWRASGGPLLEIPMACEPSTRFPIIGTTWGMIPARARWPLLSRALRKLDAFVFELHAIDFLDRGDSRELEALSRAQSDLKVPVSKKLAAYRELFEALAGETRVLTLASLAEAYEQERGAV